MQPVMFNRPLPIFAQLLAGMFLISVLVIAITNMFNYHVTSQLILNRTADSTQQSVEQLSDKIDVLLRQYDQFSQLIAFDEGVQHALSASDGTDPIAFNRYMGQKTRHMASDMLIHLFDQNGHGYSSTDSLQLFWREYEEASTVTWYSKMAALDGKMLWAYGPAWRDGEIPAIIGARKVKDTKQLHVIGDQFIVFPVDKINRMIGRTTQLIERKVQVMDSLGNIVYSSQPSEIGTAADTRLFAKFAGNGPLFFDWTTRDEDKRVYVTYAKSAYTGWTTIAYLNRESVYSDTSQIWIQALLTIAAGAVIAFILGGYFTWTLTKPIRQLAIGMSKIGRETVRPLDRRFTSREISQLYANYNRMLNQLQELIERLTEQQVSVERAQLVAMKAQFRPHFLYNSLNLIYWTIEDGRDEEAQEMTIALSDLLRYSVHPSSDLVTLRDDLDQLDRYLFLQRSRYGNIFEVSIEVEKGLEEQKVIRLMLQPLVENAFRHGLEQQAKGDWRIRVRIYSQQNKMLCSVEDNGSGLDVNTLKALEAKMVQDHVGEEKDGIGLANLHHQIQAFFGRPHGLALFASPLGGLGVVLTLPLDLTKSPFAWKDLLGGDRHDEV
jgi:two-component system sensor histidine kinase YesM